MPGGSTRMPGLQPIPTSFIPTFNAASRVVGSIDTTAPLTVYVSETVTKVSTITGFDQDTVSWSASEDCQAWQIREVANAADTIATAGQLVASGGAIPANVTQQTVILAASLTVAEGAKLLKVFAQDLAGNWSS